MFSCAFALACVPALSGCRGSGTWFNPSNEIELNTIETAESSAPSDRQGLGIRLLVIDDTNYDAPRALRAYPQLRDERVRESWSRWGFRIVEVPIDDIDPVLDSFRPVQPVSVQFMGEFGQWRPLVRSGATRQSIVRVGESSREIAPGRPMLIARSWTEPTLVDQGVRGVDEVPQRSLSAHDRGVVRDVRRGRDLTRESRQEVRATDRIEQVRGGEVIGQGDHVDGVST